VRVSDQIREASEDEDSSGRVHAWRPGERVQNPSALGDIPEHENRPSPLLRRFPSGEERA